MMNQKIVKEAIVSMPKTPGLRTGWYSWQQALRDCITNPQELLQQLQLDQQIPLAKQQAIAHFGLRVPRQFVSRMQIGDIHDPLLRQVLPVVEEMQQVEGFSHDPVGDLAANKLPGLLHKYHGRALLTVTGSCAIHCRYCFRREFPYQNNNPGRKGWQAVFDYLAKDTTIEEVIFSGGDPLSASDHHLIELIKHIESIAHIQRLRLHTRLAIVIPQRISTELLNAFKNSRLDVIMVMHCNHANEIDTTVASATQKLRTAGVQLLNQSVLLKGVNDTVGGLTDLSKRLFTVGILPYYLHMLDKVNGAAHFLVDDTTAKQLITQVSEQLSGYLVPKLVREQSGLGAKRLL